MPPWNTLGRKIPPLIRKSSCNGGPSLIFGLQNSKYYPARILNVKQNTETDCDSIYVRFLHNDKEAEISRKDAILILDHNNLMMAKVSLKNRGKVYSGTVYGNDSPKYQNKEPRFFLVRLSKREWISVSLRHIFLTKNQARKLLHRQCKVK